jgi:hypothetical protein
LATTSLASSSRTSPTCASDEIHPDRALRRQLTVSLLYSYPGRRRNDTYTKEIWFQEVGDFLANELEKEPNLPQLNNFFLPNFCCK